jgi:hypothetical protein
MSHVAAPDELHLEVDGTDLHPHTIDTRVAIDLVDAFVKLLDKVAASQDVPVYLRGFTVVDKCFQVRMTTANPEQAQAVAMVLDQIVRGGSIPPMKGLPEATGHFRSSLRKLGPGTSVKVGVGSWSQVLEAGDSPAALLPECTTTLRARLVGISVKPMRAKFDAPSEPEGFSLSITREQAVKWSPYLDQDVDIEVSIRRGPLETIVSGRVVELHPMDENTSPDAWIDWLTEAGRGWGDVEDHLKELGRTDD